MANSFYWFDLETTGTNPKWDRIVQFAGYRTDPELNPIGEADCFYVRLADDTLPNPDATLVTSITPQLLAAEGLSEWAAVAKIHALLATPGTCSVGYNSFRFDDEFTRYSLYRNLFDPYTREWQNGNSRWDLLDLVRATGALRREGIEWPQDADGLPVYRLEELSKANGIAHESAHDALSDVHATVAMARLIREKQPMLFEYYLTLRSKRAVRDLLEPFGARLCVHVSGLYPRTRFGVAPIISIGRHPNNNNSLIVVDVAEDIDVLLDEREEVLIQRMSSKDPHERPPVKEVRINRCPFVAPIEVLNEANREHLGISFKQVKERVRKLRQPAVLQKLKRIITPMQHAKNVDPEAALYDQFLQDEDRSRCRSLCSQLATTDAALATAPESAVWAQMDFHDKRLPVLAARLKARSFVEHLSPTEEADWRQFVAEKLSGSGDWLTLSSYFERIAELREAHTDARTQALLDSLEKHGNDLMQRYAITPLT